MSFSHSRLMFPCEEENVAVRDPVVKVNTSPMSQQLNSDPALQEKSQWDSQAGKESREVQGTLGCPLIRGVRLGLRSPSEPGKPAQKILYLMELSQGKCFQVYRDCQPIEKSKKST